MIQVNADNLEKEKQLAEKSEQDEQQGQSTTGEPMDTDMDFEAATTSQMDVSMGEANNSNAAGTTKNANANAVGGQEQKDNSTPQIDEEDMEELLQIQRDRLDRLKNVIVLGMDADAVKANGRNGDKEEDLLF